MRRQFDVSNQLFSISIDLGFLGPLPDSCGRLFRPASGVLCFFLVLSFANAAHTLPSYSQIFAFGDSYSESGNIGRSTESDNWLEYMATDLGISGFRASSRGGTNYSMASATALGQGVFDLATQMRNYTLRNPVADSDALYVLWIGFNDIQISSDVSDIQVFGEAIAESIHASMLTLYDAGGRNFLIPNAWDFTTTPVSRLFDSPLERDEHLAIHQAFNASLDDKLSAFPASVARVDAFGLSREIFGDPDSFGFTQGQGICPVGSADCEGFIWRDFIHPTSSVHRILADRALSAIPEPSVAVLFGLGLTALAIRRDSNARPAATLALGASDALVLAERGEYASSEA